MPLHIFTYITAIISILINCVLIFLLLSRRPRKKSHIFLAIWLFFLTLFAQAIGSLIIATPDASKALSLYQFGSLFMGPVSFIYLFVREFLNIKSKKKVIYLVFSYVVVMFLAALIKPDFFIRNVHWDEIVQFYLFEMGIGIILGAPLLFFWSYAVWKLLKNYQKSRSVIERNRLKYLIFGIIAPLLGMILVATPWSLARRYPFDMFGVTLSSIFLTYGVLRHKLLDIDIIIKKGLLYSVLTMIVTGVYLSFSLMLRFLFQQSDTALSMPTTFSTAIFVALAFQPMQKATQHFIDRLFSRRKYDAQKLVAELSQIFSETLDLYLLTKIFIKILCTTIQTKEAVLFLIDKKTGKLEAQELKNMPAEIRNIDLTPDLSFVKILSESDTIQLKYELKANNITMGGLENFDLELFIPIRSRESLQGILCLGPKLSKELYSLEELKMLETIARSAALAINNASLFTQLKQERLEMEERGLI